ncbi:hypothetical protein ACFU96_20930 [Streptomyces sp. NPDC057620]|uniref:hypothetical protein n=1 Tax=Streptomyces sp. NPDC057620 TaxID=3346185 RepID=UPI00369BA975
MLARIAAARADRDLSDYARQMVGITAVGAPAAECIRAARQMRLLATQIVDLTVLAERLAGASWQEITDALGRQDAAVVEDEYADAITEWQAKSEEQMKREAAGFPELDDWYVRHREDHDPHTSTPVADLLNRR